MRMYLDACAIVYAVEGILKFRGAVLDQIEKVEHAGGDFVTSRLSILECRVKPLRDQNQGLLAAFDGFFANGRLIVAELRPSIIDRATELRAAHGFKTPDAIHLATALEEKADVFLTGDRNLVKCPGLTFEIVV